MHKCSSWWFQFVVNYNLDKWELQEWIDTYWLYVKTKLLQMKITRNKRKLHLRFNIFPGKIVSCKHFFRKNCETSSNYSFLLYAWKDMWELELKDIGLMTYATFQIVMSLMQTSTYKEMEYAQV